MCANVGPDDAHACVALCDPTSPACDAPAEACGLPWPDAGVGVCLQSCGPLEQDCTAGQGCFQGVDATFVCLPAEPGGYGDACSHTCSPGLLCVAEAGVPDCAAASGCCTELCDVDTGGEGQCQGRGQQCVAYFGEGQAPAGYESVGVCHAP